MTSLKGPPTKANNNTSNEKLISAAAEILFLPARRPIPSLKL